MPIHTDESARISPPPERGRTASAASQVGVPAESRFNRTREKTRRARQLRQPLTAVEARLWGKLRGGRLEGLEFRRQHPAGPYILDFYCPQLRLAIELDGSQHGEEPQQQHDLRRSAWLAARGVTELRFWNNEVTQQLTGVLETIKSAADELRARGVTPTRRWRADLPLSGGGEEKA
jgi:very-short-patch-repair endonuclease